jgi:hypothetical protein
VSAGLVVNFPDVFFCAFLPRPFAGAVKWFLELAKEPDGTFRRELNAN